MRKQLLRIFTVLLLVCFGACLFAACNKKDNTEDNAQPDAQPVMYTLTYQANGGTGADVTESHKEGDTVTLKGADTFTYEDHTFKGWNDGTTTYEARKTFTMPANDVTFKAQWEENSETPPAKTYTVTMAANANVDFAIVEPTGATAFEKGTVVKFTVTAKTGFTVKSVKNGTDVLEATDGKYSVTVGEANIVITVETEDENPPAKTYTVSCTSQHVTVRFDQNGPYTTGTTVTFTVTAESGYEIVSVKNGSVVLQPQNGKYSVTVAEANIVITVETKAVGTPQPSNKNFTEFLLANILPLAERCQIAIQAKATGYASPDEMKGDAKLLIGTVEIPANEVTYDGTSGIYNLFFPIDVATLNIAVDSSAAVKLKTASKTYDCPAAGVIEELNTVQFEHDIYTLQYAAGSLTLRHTYTQNVEKKITFAGTAFAFDGDGKLYIALNLQTVQGYEETAVLAAKLKIGALEFSVRADASTKTALRFDLTGGTPTVETLTAGKHAVVLVVGGDNYKCPTVTTGQVGQQKKGEQTFTLKEEGGKLYLNVEGGAPAPTLDPIEGIWTGAEYSADGMTASFTAYVKKGDNYIDFLLEMKQVGGDMVGFQADRFPQSAENDYKITTQEGTVEVLLSDGKLIAHMGSMDLTFTTRSTEMGSVTLPASGTYSGKDSSGTSPIDISLTFGTQPVLMIDSGDAITSPIEVEIRVIGKYIVCFDKVSLSGENTFARLYLTTGATADTFTAYYMGGSPSFTLTKESAGTDPSGPSGPTDPTKSYTEFFNANLIYFNDTSFDLYLRFRQTGFSSVDEIKNDLRLVVGTATFDCAHVAPPEKDSDIYVVKFTLTAADLKIGDGDFAPVRLMSVAGMREYSCPATIVDENQKTVQLGHDFYTLVREGDTSLILKHEYKETIEKTLTFAGTAFIDNKNGGIVIAICLANTTFTVDELKTATLEIGGLTFTADSETDRTAIRFTVYGGNVSVGTLTGKQEVVLKLDGKTYRGATVDSGKIQIPIVMDGKTFTLSAEGQGDGKAMYLTIA